MRSLLVVISVFLLTSNVLAQEKSPFNDKNVVTDSTGNYSFIVSGHFYGDGTNRSHFPANTLLANLDWINDSESAMLICLGDLFKDIKNDIPNYETSFFDKLEIPLFNAVGNHDLTENIYQDNYGKTYFFFQVNNDIHVILDTEIDNGDISGDQLDLIKEVSKLVDKGKVDNVFFYGHRTIWKDTYQEMDGLFVDNTQSINTPNFEEDVYPILTDMSKKSSVYWFAGSLGPAPASFFYHKDDKCDLTIVATAIRSLPRDAVLKIDVIDGEAIFTTQSFTGQDLETLEKYDIDFWQNEVGEEPFNWKLIPYYIQLMLLHRYFWYGTTFAFIFMLIVKLIRKRRMKA